MTEGLNLTRRLKYVADVNPSVPRLADGEMVTFVPMEAVGVRGGLDVNQERPVEAVRQGYTPFCEGDVVIAKITPCFENGKGAIAEGLRSGIAYGTTELHVLRAKEADPKWLFYITQSHHFMSTGESEMYGAGGQKRVPPSFVANYRLWDVGVQQQRAIADFLDRKTAAIDALIAKKERLIELLQEKRQALITQAVTKGLDPNVPMKDSGIEWLGEIPAHWSCAPLYAHFTVQLGKMLDSKRDIGQADLFPYLRNANISWSGVDTRDIKKMSLNEGDRIRYRLRAGDLLVCEGGANAQVVGKSAIWEGQITECYYQKALHRVRPTTQGMSSRFLWYALWSAWGRGLFAAEASPTTVLHLTAEKLRSHRFPFPPFEEQREIVQYLDTLLRRNSVMSEATAKSIERLREYRQALITEAVTGKLDVTKEDAA